MLARCPFSGVWIAALELLEDPAVLREHTVHASGADERLRAEATDVVTQVRADPAQRAVRGDAVEEIVEGDIRAHDDVEPSFADRLVHRLDDEPQPDKIVGGHTLCGEPSRQTVEDLPHEVDVLDLRGLRLAHDQAPQGIGGDEVSVGEPLQRLANRGAADPAGRRECRLHQAGPGWQLAAEDHVPQTLVGALAARQTVGIGGWSLRAGDRVQARHGAFAVYGGMPEP